MRVKLNLTVAYELKKKLSTLAKGADGLCKYSMYESAGLAFLAIWRGVDGLSVVSDVAAVQAWLHGTPTYICYTQRACLYNSLGISPMRKKNGAWSVKAGFDNKDPVTGYNVIHTKRWPKGQPNIMIAASCEHGSTAMIAQPFIRPAFESSKGELEQRMVESCQDWIQATLAGRRAPSRRGARSLELGMGESVNILGVWYGSDGRLRGWKTDAGYVPHK